MTPYPDPLPSSVLEQRLIAVRINLGDQAAQGVVAVSGGSPFTIGATHHIALGIVLVADPRAQLVDLLGQAAQGVILEPGGVAVGVGNRGGLCLLPRAASGAARFGIGQRGSLPRLSLFDFPLPLIA